MKGFKKIVVLLLAAFMIFGASACGSKSKGDDSTEVRIYLWSDNGSTPEGFDEVVNHFNTTYGPQLGLTVKFSFDTQDDYKQKLNLSMSADQNNYDMVFDANWIYLNDFAKKGYYYELSEFFGSDAYPGLKSSFSESYLNNNRFNGGVYGIPLTETFGEISVAYIRKDWRIACAADETFVKPAGIASSAVKASDLSDGIDNFDELEYYLYWLKENKSGVTPILSNKDATWGAWDVINSREVPSKSAQDFANAGIKREIILPGGLTATAYIKNGQVMAANIADQENPAAENSLNDYPAGFNTPDNAWQSNYLLANKWKKDGIISADVLNTTDSDAKFKAGQGGCVVQTINNFNNVEATVKKQNPGAEIEIFVNDKTLREKRVGYAQTDFKAWNYLAVPKSTSENKLKLCMKFMNWLFESQENHDLFQYGIKGKHWDVAKDENGAEIEGTVVSSLENVYSFPAYELTWNPSFIRVTKASDPKVMEYMKYMYDASRYVEIPYSSFTFDHQRTQALSTALSNAAINENIAKAKSYYLGQNDDPVNKWNAELASRYNNQPLQAALKVIKDEVMTQLQMHIDNL